MSGEQGGMALDGGAFGMAGQGDSDATQGSLKAQAYPAAARAA